MSETTFLVTLFSIVFLVLGLAATYLRRTSDINNGPILQETIGWASGTLMLAWIGIIHLLEFLLPQGVIYSVGGVFLIAIAMNATALYTGIKLAGRYHPDWHPTVATVDERVQESATEPPAD